jgi:hypothetical protein
MPNIKVALSDAIFNRVHRKTAIYQIPIKKDEKSEVHYHHKLQYCCTITSTAYIFFFMYLKESVFTDISIVLHLNNPFKGL